jgi:hypothetical protein
VENEPNYFFDGLDVSPEDDTVWRVDYYEKADIGGTPTSTTDVDGSLNILDIVETPISEGTGSGHWESGVYIPGDTIYRYQGQFAVNIQTVRTDDAVEVTSFKDVETTVTRRGWSYNWNYNWNGDE